MTQRLDPQQHIWMTAPETRAVLDALGDARFVGGAVRNALLDRDVTDIDIATPLLPAAVVERLAEAGIRSVPTGIEHGTVTAISNGKAFEITTLRRDVSTDGRRATVAFTTDWAEDAARRDFTINALYASVDGELFDYANGLADLENRVVRFVGDPVTRIREDYLRILRLFRFHAWYGRGDIDAQALQAAAAEKSGIAQLSGERIQKEMLRLLEAENPLPALRVMVASGILGEILPGELNFARLDHLLKIEADNFFAPDALLRLAALLADGTAAHSTAERFRFSNEARTRLEDITSGTEKLVSYLSIKEVRKLLYQMGRERFKDRVMLGWAEDPKPTNGVQWRMLLSVADAWQRPQFPLTGRHVMSAGVPEGQLVGRILADVEAWWIDADFTDDEFSLAERLKAVVQAVAY